MRKGLILVLAVLMLGVFFGMTSSKPTTLEAIYLLQTMDAFSGKNIYFGESHSEASPFDRSEDGLSRYAGLMRQLGAELRTLEWRRGVPSDADLVVIAGPVSDLDDDQVARLWSYLNQGGSVLLIGDPPVDNYRAFRQESGLFDLTWTDWGVRGLNDVVVVEAGIQVIEVDEIGGQQPTPTPEATGPTIGSETAEIEVPVLMTQFVTNVLGDHPITQGIDDPLFFSQARSIQVDASIQDVEVTSLVSSPAQFYGETEYERYLEIARSAYNLVDDTPRGELPLVVALENPNTSTRLVLIGDREFATNGHGLVTSPEYSASFVYPGNAQLLLQATAWLLSTEVSPPSYPTAAPTATPTPAPTPTPTPVF